MASHKGHKSQMEYSRRQEKVRKGLAEKWLPLRSIDDAFKAAGLPP